MPGVAEMNREYRRLSAGERATHGFEGVLYRVALPDWQRSSLLFSRRQGHLFFAPETGWQVQVFPWCPVLPNSALVRPGEPATSRYAFNVVFFLLGVAWATVLCCGELGRIGRRGRQEAVC